MALGVVARRGMAAARGGGGGGGGSGSGVQGFTGRDLDFVSARLAVVGGVVRPGPDPKWTAPGRRAAVLVPLCHVNGGDAAILFTVRSAGLRNHRNEVRYSMDRDGGGSKGRGGWVKVSRGPTPSW
jgi:hypothetical protein